MHIHLRWRAFAGPFLLLGRAGCGQGIPAADAAGAAGAAGAAETRPSGPVVPDFGRGLLPHRGPVQVLPPRSLAVEFEPAEMSFGVLSPGTTVQGTSRIWNVGTEPLRITKSIASCGCTSAEDLAGRVIEPGGYTEFSTTMSMKSGLGEKKEKITVYFEGALERVAVQYYTAEVSLPVRVTPPHIAASQFVGERWMQTTKGTLQVSAQDGIPFRIIRSHGEAPDVLNWDPAVDEPRSEYTIRWNLERFQGGAIPWFWVLETDRADCPVLDVRLQHSSTLPARPEGRPWMPKDQRAIVGVVRRGEPFEVTSSVEYSGGYPPDPASADVVSESPALLAELIEAQVEGQHLNYRIRVTAAASAPPGLLYGAVALHASEFDALLFIIGRVE